MRGKQSRLRAALLVVGCMVVACVGQADPDAASPLPEERQDPTAQIATPANGCEGQIDPNRPALHRLNRAEYDNTVRDLLGDTLQPARAFPSDDYGYGFDNIGDVLSMSPLLVEKYDVAAHLLSDEIVTREAAADPSTAKLRTCDPAKSGEDACFRQIVTAFLKRAWRRPPTQEEIERLSSMLPLAKANGDGFDQALELAVQAALLSPNFLFRVELDPDPASALPHALNDYELASRLSYFLWSSTPDDTLLQVADEGRLQDPSTIETQVRRMLSDPRSRALTDNFAGQWLKIRALSSVSPDDKLFPTFDEPLRQAMKDESNAFFSSFLHEDQPVTSMLDADFTYLNDRLAEHYGAPKPGSAELQRTSTKGLNRGGVLTLGSILTVTSHPNRTSPVLRGKFVLTNLLCSEPPPPPPNVAQLSGSTTTTQTLREALEAHRANPACASCHSVMDPIGFGMDNFDAVGRYRTEENGLPIDATGKLVTGETFNGAAELARLLKADPRFTRCVANKLLTYGVGRGIRFEDGCAVQSVEERAKARGGRLADFIVEIATSPNFTSRRGEPEGGTP